jgi:hypothetical protein
MSHGISRVWGLALTPFIAGCNPSPDEPGGELPTRCQRELQLRNVGFVTTSHAAEHPDDHPELTCTIEDPLLLDPVIHGVSFVPSDVEQPAEPLLASCGLALAIEQTAALLAERNVVGVAHFGTYGCRSIAGSMMLSEHAVGRAIDLAAMRQLPNRVMTVLDDWQIDPPHQEPADLFLHELAQDLFDRNVFNIILTPNFNADHRDHLHLDLTPNQRFMQ